MGKMWSKPPLQIPGKSIRPPDKPFGIKCPHCGKGFLIPKKKVDPYTKRVRLVCPHCEGEL